MAFYDDMAAVATSMLSEFGAVLTVRDLTGETFDPVTGAVTGGSNSDTTVNGILTVINEENFPGADIEAGDKLAVLDGDIGIGNLLIAESESWKCVSVRRVNPAGTPIVWFAQVRK